ncbi:unnamed protein product [Echinostoma caproni]|uniref:CUB domain-containing protein n=1 Tax=Echinostoma caproni TaxID=27848 RepID=A0A183BBJ6_9TREM|nr:unnamed protein product [Echinostoma caproni]
MLAYTTDNADIDYPPGTTFKQEPAPSRTCPGEITLTDDTKQTITAKDATLTKDKKCLITVKNQDSGYNVLLTFTELQFGDGTETCDTDYVKFAKDEASLTSADKHCKVPSPAEQTIEGGSAFIEYFASTAQKKTTGFVATVQRGEF